MVPADGQSSGDEIVWKQKSFGEGTHKAKNSWTLGKVIFF